MRKPYTQREVRLRLGRADDKPTLEAIWARQSETLGNDPGEFADPTHPNQFLTLVAEDATTGEVVGAGAARTVVELAFVIDPAWATPRDRMRVAMRLMAEGFPTIWARGFKEVFARIVGKRRWAQRLVDTCGWTRETEPIVKFDLTTVLGGGK